MSRSRAKLTSNKIRRCPKSNVLEREAIDRTYTCHLMVSELLDDHPSIEGDPEAVDLRDTVRDRLWDLYQHLGGERLA